MVVMVVVAVVMAAALPLATLRRPMRPSPSDSLVSPLPQKEKKLSRALTQHNRHLFDAPKANFSEMFAFCNVIVIPLGLLYRFHQATGSL